MSRVTGDVEGNDLNGYMMGEYGDSVEPWDNREAGNNEGG